MVKINTIAVIVVTSLGVLLLLAGSVLLGSPATYLSALAWAKSRRFIRLISVLRVILGLFLILGAAPVLRLPSLIRALGVLSCISGLVGLTLPFSRVSSIIGWFERQSLWTLRGFGLVPLGLGGILLLAALG